MKETNKKIIIKLMIIVLLLCILFILALTGEIRITPKEENTNLKVTEHEKNIEKSSYTYEELKGLYSFESELTKDENNNEYKKSYTLYLYENGTFRYRNSTFAPRGYIGNYIIIDDKIRLNYLYSTNSGVGIFAAKGSTEIKIINNNELLMLEDLLDKNNKNDETLKRDISSEKTSQYEKTTVNDLIEQEEKMNQSH